MNNKMLISLSITTALILSTNPAVAGSPKIEIVFSDPAGVCKDENAKTQFAFNYSYSTDKDFEYYSGPVNINNPIQLISAPLPVVKDYKYNMFAITDSGMCGKRDLNYANRGDCYNVNLIPASAQNYSYSYKITLTPKAMPDQAYGASYNLNCKVKKLNSIPR